MRIFLRLSLLCIRFWIPWNLFCQCPNPSVITGYQGNLGTTAGNCQTEPLPPLCAFGSVSVNQNAPVQTVNRLNPQQLPTTNNWQLFQNECAIDPTLWTETGVAAGAGTYRTRTGPYLVGMAQTGPVVTVAQFNFNQNVQLPNLTADNRITFFFSATETNGGSNNYFSISTNVVNSETCVLTYTPNNGTPGGITDYNVTGNVFHDVYYDNLHPALAISNPPVVNGGNTGILMSVSTDGVTMGNVANYPFGSTVTGKIFQIFVQRYSPLGPAVYLLYVVDPNDDPLTFTVAGASGSHFILTLDSSQPAYTGFLRLASVSTNDANPTEGSPWNQASYFMPEDIGNAADTSNPPSSCPIEQTGCPLTPTSPSWWETAEVHAIAPTGMNLYMLLPGVGTTPNPRWSALFTDLAFNVIGSNWINTNMPIQYPTSQALSDILPPIATANSALAQTYYSDLFSQLNPSGMPPYTDGSDLATNLFTLQFDIIMASNLSSDINTFQEASRTLPIYAPGTVNNVSVFNAHRRYVPVQADISTTATTISWTYTLSSAVPPGDGMNKTLVCFPFWKYLQGSTPGYVNTAPGTGEPFQPFIFNDTIKGTLYAAESISGVVTYLEGGIPFSWYGPTDLFIPSSLTFTTQQLSLLSTALGYIQNTVIPLPYVPEANVTGDAYNAGKVGFMLAKTALYIAYYMQNTNPPSTPQLIAAATQKYIDNAKSILTAYLIGRTPGANYFVADRSAGGICVNGAGGDGTYANGPNLQQYVDSGVDFGNYVYNDHHFFAGYRLLTAAMITNWEMTYGSGTLWIDLPVIGADNGTYKIRDMVDFLWRDTHNPFTNNTSAQIYDPDLPYDRYGLPWEGHGVANGIQYQPNALGRNQESIAEDFNCWLGMNTYAALVLQTSLTGPQTLQYQTLYNFSLMNLKLNASAGIQWFKDYAYWVGVNQYSTNPSSTAPAIYIGQFTQATVTNGQVNDNSAQNQTFF